jgi:hypothetical protein
MFGTERNDLSAMGGYRNQVSHLGVRAGRVQRHSSRRSGRIHHEEHRMVNASEASASEDTATDSGNVIRLQFSSRTVSVAAGGPALEQPPTMINNSAAPREANLRALVASPVRV